MNPEGALIFLLGLMVVFGVLLTVFRLINFVARRKVLPLWIPFVLLIGGLLAGSFFLDAAGTVHEVKVTDKREEIKYVSNFYRSRQWHREFYVQVEQPPGTETPGMSTLTLYPDAATFDAVQVGQNVKVRLLQLGELFRFARLADRSTVSIFTDLYAEFFPPEPRGPWREANATVLQVNKFTEHRSRSRRGRRGSTTPLPWPYQIVRMSYTPPGRTQPLEVMDNVEIASKPDLAEHSTVQISWAEDNPRVARIVGARPGRPWANLFYVFGETLMIIAGLVVIVLVAAFFWRRRKRQRGPWLPA
jgi:LPXTG-motif cell wall-anchored protein